MSEPTPGAAAPTAATETSAPAPTATEPQAKPNAPQEAASPEQSGLSLSSDQLKLRLDRAREAERAALLQSLGVTSLDDAKAAIEAKRQQEESQKTLEQRLAELQAAREQDQARLTSLQSTVAQRADFELATLTDSQRDAVKALAGDDPAAQLRAVTTLRPTWQAAPQSQEQAAPKPPPANTAPPRSQPSDGGMHSQTDHAAEYARLKANPATAAAAAIYFNAYSRQILASRRSGAS